MSKKELEKEKASLIKWVSESEDPAMIKYFSDLRREKPSFEELREQLKEKENKPKEKLTALQKLLLRGPVMTDKQLKEVQERRKHLNEWK